MGLDMFMFKIERVPEAEADSVMGTHVKNLNNKDFLWFDKSRDGEEDWQYRELVPYATEVELVETRVNDKLIFDDFNITEDDIVGSSSGYDETVLFLSHNREPITISREQMMARYTYDTYVQCYIVKCQQIGYWRGDDELDNFLQRTRIEARASTFMKTHHRPPQKSDYANWKTQNCAYYMMDQSETEALIAHLECTEIDSGDVDIVELYNTQNSIAYMAWW